MLSDEQKALKAAAAPVIEDEEDEDEDEDKAGGDDSGDESEEDVSEDELAALKADAGDIEEEETPAETGGRRSRRGGGRKDYAGTCRFFTDLDLVLTYDTESR